MAAGATYFPLVTTTLTSAAATVSFTSISGTYTDLIIVSDNIQSGGTQGNLFIQFNGDTSSKYSRTWLSGDGTNPISASETNQTKMGITAYAYPQTTSRWAASINIQNYSNTTTNKAVLIRGNNSVVGTDVIIGLWRSTSAITSIVLSRSNDNFASGSTFTLIGIKAA